MASKWSENAGWNRNNAQKQWWGNGGDGKGWNNRVLDKCVKADDCGGYDHEDDTHYGFD